MQTYETLYRDTPDALGPPSPEVKAFFAAQDRPLRVLDAGCGQGRDTLFAARTGHQVVAVDSAPSGIDALRTTAQTEGLEVLGVVADLTTDAPEGTFDVVLFDRVLHLIPGNARLRVLRTLLGAVAPGGWCVILDERVLMPSYRRVAEAHPAPWHIETAKRGLLVVRRV